MINANDKLRQHDKLFAIVAGLISDPHLHNCSPSLQFPDEENKMGYETLAFSLRQEKTETNTCMEFLIRGPELNAFTQTSVETRI